MKCTTWGLVRSNDLHAQKTPNKQRKRSCIAVKWAINLKNNGFPSHLVIIQSVQCFYSFVNWNMVLMDHANVALVMTCHLSVIWQFSAWFNKLHTWVWSSFMSLNSGSVMEYDCIKLRVLFWSQENMERTNQTPHPSYLNTGKYHPACVKAIRNKMPHVSHSP